MKNIGLKKMEGINRYYQDLFHSDETILKNVIGILPGKSKKEELVIFSAHYDHIGSGDVALGFDPIYKDREKTIDTINGANDNASGIAAMLAIAAYYLKKGPQERSIVFIAFSGEEIGMFGSGSLTNVIVRENVVAQFNLIMLGRRNKLNENPFVTGDSLSDLRILMNNCLEASNGTKDYFLQDNSGEEQLFYRSENIELAKEGVTAHTIMLTTASDPFYHSPKDEPATLDYKLMATIVKNIAFATACFVNGTTTPKRIKSLSGNH